jgi:murein DD-endopeptidase MepM/ murein hydrolase activator NlpD
MQIDMSATIIHNLYKTTKRVDILTKELAIQQIIRLYFKISQRENKLLSAIPAIQPVRNENQPMVSGFGYRTDPFTKARKCMKGWTSHKTERLFLLRRWHRFSSGQ